MAPGPKAIIVGSAGQDGTLLGEMLRSDGVQVLGIEHRGIVLPNGSRGPALNLLEPAAVADIVRLFSPDALYYLAAFHQSSEDLITNNEHELLRQSRMVHVDGFVNFLDAIVAGNLSTRVFYAASSHVFGWPTPQPQSESTPFDPQCAYGVTKAEGIAVGRKYRTGFGLAVSSGILYNHESWLRRSGFVSHKLARGAVQIARSSGQGTIEIGDLDSRVDWGYAPDTCHAMRLIMQQDVGDDYVIATGEMHSIAEFAQVAFEAVGIANWRDHVVVNPGVVTRRPRLLCGDSSKLRAATGWTPSVSFGEMVRRLVEGYQHASEAAVNRQ